MAEDSNIALSTSKENYIFIYDFDDTLCPSKIESDIKSLEETVYNLIKQCDIIGTVYIVTNAKESWVKNRIDNYLPKLRSLPTKLKIMSARDLFGNGIKNVKKIDLIHWKTLAIYQILKQLHPNSYINVISIGDSNVEKKATILATARFSNCIGKTIKLKPNSSSKDLEEQLQTITASLDYITNCSGKDFELFI
jgi:hypothetical protein